jgi:hypothetical protein
MRRIIALSLLLGIAAPAMAEQPRPVVVELFTSQGCSACPPADALLSELAQRSDVLALAFHVTYWNSLGWRDPFSLDLATDRQRLYQRLLGTETVYTPQMIVDGRTDVVGSDRRGVAYAIAAAMLDSTVPMEVARSGPGLRIAVGAGKGDAGLIVVGYDSVRRTSVQRGENAGRQLSESNIVRNFQKVADWTGQPLSLAIPLPLGERVAIILQASDGRILGAASLPKPNGVSE